MAMLPSFVTNHPQPYAQTTAMTTTRLNPFVDAINAAFEDAMAMRTKLRDEAFRVDGFSGKKFRIFMNNIVSELEKPRYLEIGLFRGASFCPAIFKNKVHAVGIDNWSEYNGTPKQFHDNIALFRSELSDVIIIEQDFRTVDYAAIGPFNILFYDGSHAEKDQFDGVLLPQSGMADKYILIVDDWNWARVRKGTYDALKAAKAKIDFQLEVRTSFNEEHLPLVNGRGSEWHHGCLIAAVSKSG
jgi:hypothetical protein